MLKWVKTFFGYENKVETYEQSVERVAQAMLEIIREAILARNEAKLLAIFDRMNEDAIVAITKRLDLDEIQFVKEAYIKNLKVYKSRQKVRIIKN